MERRFWGYHPWQAGEGCDLGELRRRLEEDGGAGVGEIGLDRLRARAIAPEARELFEAQLDLAAEMGRPVALHGAKCWGEVVKACAGRAGRIPGFLFHGFSRSLGLLEEMWGMNGFVGVGLAVLNGHAENYRAMVKGLPGERILLETDADYGEDAGANGRVGEIAGMVAELRGVRVEEVLERAEENFVRFAK